MFVARHSVTACNPVFSSLPARFWAKKSVAVELLIFAKFSQFLWNTLNEFPRFLLLDLRYKGFDFERFAMNDIDCFSSATSNFARNFTVFRYTASQPANNIYLVSPNQWTNANPAF